jgi:FkbM family methyltransferase
MKVDKLVCANQPDNWFQRITSECQREYPIHLMEDLERDELVIDAGCNVGGFTEAWKWRFGNILAIDASSYNVEEYKSHHHHSVLHKALYSKDNEKVQLRKYMVNDNDTETGSYGITGFTSDNGHGWNSEEYEEVETISLETLLAPYDEVGLLKIDIEGAEYDFLLNKDLSKIKWITGEFHNFLFYAGDKGIELMNWIATTHDEVYSDGNGVDSHYVKLFKRR